MNRRAESFVEEVTGYMDVSERVKRRLSEDLSAHILDAAGEGATDREIEAVIARMGDAKELAAELTEMLYADKESAVRELAEAKARLRSGMVYEYKSERRLFGLPLVHVHFTRGTRYGWGYGRVGFRARPAVAKGVIAIGDVSFGLISIGGFAFGGLCFGGIAAGLLSLGGICLGLLLALGGVAIGSFALGGVAIGLFAFGGCAVAAQVAIGGYARGTVAVGGEAFGTHVLSVGGDSLNTAMISRQAVRALIEQAYPALWKPIVNLLTLPFAP